MQKSICISRCASVDVFVAGSPYCDGEASRAVQPLAIFYGSGEDFSQPRVPDEFQWSVKKLDADIACGRISLLEVVAAIKNAMPVSWLADHGFSADCLSIVFSKSREEVVDTYTAALSAWGAVDILEPQVLNPPAVTSHVPVQSQGPSAHRAQLLLKVMQMLSQELQLCLSTHPAPPDPCAELAIADLEVLQSMFLSARLGEASGRGASLEMWTKLSTQLPQVLTLSCREYLFRLATGTFPEHFQRMKKDRVNGVDRSCILDWAESIAAAIRGRRNLLAIQVQITNYSF
jgi:hypothetical protein